MQTEEIKKYIEDHQEEMVEDLAGFIGIPSVSSDKKNVRRALDYALELGKKFGFSVQAVCDHQVGIIEVGSGEETVGILAHVDVVPSGDVKNWVHDPFHLTLDQGKLYGRGTEDDKGPIIACLYAMRAVVESGKPLKKKIQMILGTQEEVQWVDMERYVKEYPLPDYGFTPDGEFPLCNIEKGLVEIPMIFPFDLDNQVKKDGWHLTLVDAGTVTNAVPGKCLVELTKYQNGQPVDTDYLEIEGKAVHSCEPEKGENPLFLMAERLASYDLVDNYLLQLFTMVREKFASYYGKEIGLYSGDDMYQGEFVHRNVFAPTLFKTHEREVQIHINVRFAYGTEGDEILDVFHQLARTYGGHLGETECQPAVYVSKDRPFMKAFGQAYEEGSGRKHEFVLAFGGSYAKAMPNIVSWGPLFPDEEDSCHQDNENISMKSLLDNGKIFAIALSKVALSDKQFK